MANVRVKLNRKAVRELLKSHEIANVCEAEAKRMTEATGMPYHHNIYVGKTRVNAQGQTNDKDIMKSVKTYEGKRSARKKKGSWVTVDGQKRYIKGYVRKKEKG